MFGHLKSDENMVLNELREYCSQEKDGKVWNVTVRRGKNNCQGNNGILYADHCKFRDEDRDKFLQYNDKNLCVAFKPLDKREIDHGAVNVSKDLRKFCQQRNMQGKPWNVTLRQGRNVCQGPNDIVYKDICNFSDLQQDEFLDYNKNPNNNFCIAYTPTQPYQLKFKLTPQQWNFLNQIDEYCMTHENALPESQITIRINPDTTRTDNIVYQDVCTLTSDQKNNIIQYGQENKLTISFAQRSKWFPYWWY